MKNLKLTLIIAVLFAFSTATYAQQAENTDNSIQASFVKTEKQSMLVHVNKTADELVRVEIKDAYDHVIYTKVVKDSKFSGKFDFSNVADGTYTIIVKDSSGIVASREISIYTSREIAMR